MRSMTQLESQLKVLSASTLSMSSSSSLGSLSSSHASSKGSLSSLSFTDIYGLSTTSEPSMVDLHKKILPPHQAMSSHQVGGVTFLKRIVIFIFKKFFYLYYIFFLFFQPTQPPRSTSQQSLSPHSSLSSLSPPVTPLEPGYSFDSSRTPQKQPLRLSTIDESNRVGLELEYLLKRASDNRSQDSGVVAPLSPTSEVAVSTSTSASTASSSRVMSSAISNESVAGDSGKKYKIICKKK